MEEEEKRKAIVRFTKKQRSPQGRLKKKGKNHTPPGSRLGLACLPFGGPRSCWKLGAGPKGQPSDQSITHGRTRIKPNQCLVATHRQTSGLTVVV